MGMCVLQISCVSKKYCLRALSLLPFPLALALVTHGLGILKPQQTCSVHGYA